MSSELAITPTSDIPASRMVGRYLMYEEIASGGMASVHFGRLFGAVGFSRTVAIKHLHSHYCSDAEFVSMFVDEARLAARIQHPNVAAPLDVVLEDSGEIFLIMEYVHGDTLARLIGSARSANVKIPVPVCVSIMNGALHGLHAAHEAVDETGRPLGIVHRDMSPQNIMIGTDGVARVLDFGIAKAVSRCQSTQQGHLKGKLSYMAPEQMRLGPVDRRLDVFAAGIVLWEALTHRRLFKPDDAVSALSMIMNAPIKPPSTVNRDVPAALDKVVMRALERDLSSRFQTSLEFADALEAVVPLASHRKVGEWVERLCSTQLSKRAEKVSRIERSTADLSSPAQALLRSSTQERAAGSPSSTRPSESTNSRADIPPSTPPSYALVNDAPVGRRVWPLVVVSTLALALGAGGLYQLRKTDANPKGRTTSAPLAPGPAVQPIQATQPSVLEAQVPAARPEQLPGLAAKEAPGEQVSERKTSADKAGVPASANHRSASGVPPSQRAKAKSVLRKSSKTNKSAVRRDCDPPYYLDGNGIRRVKPQCL